MSTRLPEHVEPLRLAELGRSFQGRIPVSRLRRLGQSLSSLEGEVDVALEFSSDAQGRRRIAGRIRATLEVVCQRCLEPMVLELCPEPHLGLVESEAEAEALGDDLEPLVVSEGPMSLADIVEDELILSLPLVPMHALEACPGASFSAKGAEGQRTRESPFAVLAQIKHRDN